MSGKGKGKKAGQRHHASSISSTSTPPLKTFSSLQQHGTLGYLPTSGPQSVDGLDAEALVLLTKLKKRDPTTRIKALAALIKRIDVLSDADLEPIILHWPRLYARLTPDSNRKIRELTQAVWRVLCTRGKKQITPVLQAMMGPWLCAMFDSIENVSSCARAAFEETFPENRRGSSLTFCQTEALQHFQWSLTEVNLQTLQDGSSGEDEVELREKLLRIQYTAAKALNHYLKTLELKSLVKAEEHYKALLQTPKLWKLCKTTHAHLHRAVSELAYEAISHHPVWVEDIIARIVKACTTGLSSKDEHIKASALAAAVAFATLPDDILWNVVSFSSLAVPLTSLLKAGGGAQFTTTYHGLPHIIRAAPKDTDATVLEGLFEALSQGVLSFPRFDRQRFSKWAAALTETGTQLVARDKRLWLAVSRSCRSLLKRLFTESGEASEHDANVESSSQRVLFNVDRYEPIFSGPLASFKTIETAILQLFESHGALSELPDLFESVAEDIFSEGALSSAEGLHHTYCTMMATLPKAKRGAQRAAVHPTCGSLSHQSLASPQSSRASSQAPSRVVSAEAPLAGGDGFLAFLSRRALIASASVQDRDTQALCLPAATNLFMTFQGSLPAPYEDSYDESTVEMCFSAIGAVLDSALKKQGSDMVKASRSSIGAKDSVLVLVALELMLLSDHEQTEARCMAASSHISQAITHHTWLPELISVFQASAVASTPSLRTFVLPENVFDVLVAFAHMHIDKSDWQSFGDILLAAFAPCPREEGISGDLSQALAFPGTFVEGHDDVASVLLSSFQSCVAANLVWAWVAHSDANPHLTSPHDKDEGTLLASVLSSVAIVLIPQYSSALTAAMQRAIAEVCAHALLCPSMSDSQRLQVIDTLFASSSPAAHDSSLLASPLFEETCLVLVTRQLTLAVAEERTALLELGISSQYNPVRVTLSQAHGRKSFIMTKDGEILSKKRWKAHVRALGDRVSVLSKADWLFGCLHSVQAKFLASKQTSSALCPFSHGVLDAVLSALFASGTLLSLSDRVGLAASASSIYAVAGGFSELESLAAYANDDGDDDEDEDDGDEVGPNVPNTTLAVAEPRWMDAVSSEDGTTIRDSDDEDGNGGDGVNDDDDENDDDDDDDDDRDGDDDGNDDSDGGEADEGETVANGDNDNDSDDETEGSRAKSGSQRLNEGGRSESNARASVKKKVAVSPAKVVPSQQSGPLWRKWRKTRSRAKKRALFGHMHAMEAYAADQLVRLHTATWLLLHPVYSTMVAEDGSDMNSLVSLLTELHAEAILSPCLTYRHEVLLLDVHVAKMLQRFTTSGVIEHQVRRCIVFGGAVQFFALAHVAKVGGSLQEKEVVALLAQLARGEYSFPASMSLERGELYSAAGSIATTLRPLSDAEHSTPVLRKIKPSLRAATYDTRIANVSSTVMGAAQSLLAEAAIASSLQTALTQRISVLAAKAGGNHNGGDDEEDDEVDDELDGDLFSNPTHHLSSLSKAVACAHALCQKSKFAAEQQFASAPLEKMSTHGKKALERKRRLDTVLGTATAKTWAVLANIFDAFKSLEDENDEVFDMDADEFMLLPEEQRAVKLALCIEYAKLAHLALVHAAQHISAELWDMILCFVIEWLQLPLVCLQAAALVSWGVRISVAVDALVSRVAQAEDIHASLPQALTKMAQEWREFYTPQVGEAVLKAFLRTGSFTAKSSNAALDLLVQELAIAVNATCQPTSITEHASLAECVPLLHHFSRHVRTTAFACCVYLITQDLGQVSNMADAEDSTSGSDGKGSGNDVPTEEDFLEDAETDLDTDGHDVVLRFQALLHEIPLPSESLFRTAHKMQEAVTKVTSLGTNESDAPVQRANASGSSSIYAVQDQSFALAGASERLSTARSHGILLRWLLVTTVFIQTKPKEQAALSAHLRDEGRVWSMMTRLFEHFIGEEHLLIPLQDGNKAMLSSKQWLPANTLAPLRKDGSASPPSYVADFTMLEETASPMSTTPLGTTAALALPPSLQRGLGLDLLWNRSWELLSLKPVQSLALRVYQGMLTRLPAVSRTWFEVHCPKRHKAQVLQLTAKYISPVLIRRELSHAHRHVVQGEESELRVRARYNVSEVSAIYEYNDAMSMELIISLPSIYPLQVVEVRTEKRIGVPANEWRKWMLQVIVFISNQNGTILDALKMWKTNIDKKFEGVEECCICYAVVHGQSYQFPRVKCATCKKLFHSSCIYTWFNTSGNDTCPLCRSVM